LTEVLAQLDEHGFCVVEDVLARDETKSVADRLERAYMTYDAGLVTGEAANEDGISRPSEISFAPNLARQDAAMAQFCRRPELLLLAAQALGPDVDFYWDQLVFKAPETAKDFPWHQDDAYGRVDPSPYLTLWIALNDATAENGCMWVLPGSHKRGFIPHRRGPEGLACHDNTHADQGVQVPVAAGSILVFWSLTVHKSGPNLSGDVRRAYIVQYTKAGTRDAATGKPVDAIPVLRSHA
jgi:ectoine hydroxylase-related dioxygenase (phytanoyl-CoA dioxygenase family)